MIKTFIAASLALTSIVAVSLPAQAAKGDTAVPYCDSSVDISANADTILQQLDAKGVKATSVEDWNGCVRAFIVNPNGSQGMAFFDPDTLQPVKLGTAAEV